MQHILKNIAIFSLLILALLGCQKTKVDPVTGKKIRFEPNTDKRAEKAVIEEGFILGGGKQVDNFATKNILWRASLETLDFVPLNSANYAGGMIISDWYSKANSNESVKIEVRFFSKEISLNSFEIKNYKKICKNQDRNCSITQGSEKLNKSIKNKILVKARELKIKEVQKK